MSIESLHAAMNEPIGTAYSAPVPDCEETMGLFGSAAFWISGAICVGLWGWLLHYVIWGLK